MKPEIGLIPAQGPILLAWARACIEAKFLSGHAQMDRPSGGAFETKAGAFVSLHEGGKLRGCIGRMVADRALADTVASMAQAAAFEDPRFPPLRQGELASIELEITVLSPMEKLLNVAEIEIGRHGLYLVKGWRSGVFLPQVPVEQGWDRAAYLENLCYKAGLGSEAWRAPDAELFVFEGLILGEARNGTVHAS